MAEENQNKPQNTPEDTKIKSVTGWEQRLKENEKILLKKIFYLIAPLYSKRRKKINPSNNRVVFGSFYYC